MRAPSLHSAPIAMALVVLAAPSERVQAQLISPGKLAAVHSTWDGIRNCTQCHQLRQRGAPDDRCLNCHTLLAGRIAEQRGYHARVTDQSCADCHKEHLGRDFDIKRFDRDAFDHEAQAGFALVDSHAEADCRDCHTPDLIKSSDVRAYKAEHDALDDTFLGLGTTCEACHQTEAPHRDQFGSRRCEDCHAQERWEKTPGFDHNDTRYRLTGAHRRVDCADCHRTVDSADRPFVLYRPLRFATCLDCHQDDHRGAFGRTCTKCHNTGDWNRVNRSRVEGEFDHETTDFPLVGSHATAECTACHANPPPRTDEIRITLARGTSRSTYPPPVVQSCLSCHVDYHSGEFREVTGGAVCENCHGEDAWFPTTYGIDRHNRESDFALDGAHMATPCTACHDNAAFGHEGLTFGFAQQACADCHSADDPHQAQFGDSACDDCHVTDSYAIPSFDHDRTPYPLDGEHRPVPCEGCHTSETSPDGALFARYRPLGTACRDCHGDPS